MSAISGNSRVAWSSGGVMSADMSVQSKFNNLEDTGPAGAKWVKLLLRFIYRIWTQS